MAKRIVSKSTSSRRPAVRATELDDNLSSSASFSGNDSMEESASVRAPRSSALRSGGNKNMWKDLVSNPAVRYVAGGIATAILTKVASNFSTKYPEISRFINENLDNVEGRLADFKNGLNSNSEASRH